MALFGRGKNAGPATVDPPEETLERLQARGLKKEGRTPTRKEAEALRRQRVTRNLTKKEARAEASRASRAARMQAIQARDNTPEKALLRDYVDARRNLGEFLLPSLLVILALTFLTSLLPRVTVITTAVMYLFILLVIVDLWVMWRGFTKVLQMRLPRSSPRGLLLYGANRAIQLRRFRIPAPRVKRGATV